MTFSQTRWLVTLVVLVLAANRTWAYTPESPQVVAAIERGVKYLENAEIRTGGEDGIGEEALVGLALVKTEQGLDHPRIKSALERCVKYANGEPASERSSSMYAVSMVAIFLMEADANAYRPQIQKLLDVILKRQLANGAWDYLGSNVGDTSQSQYCVLALWEAYNHEFDFDLRHVSSICQWLIRTQDPSGAFAYKGRDSGELGRRIKQDDTVSHSLAAAGCGSLYICTDLFGFHREGGVDDSAGELPPNVRLVTEETDDNAAKKRREPAFGIIPMGPLVESINLGNNWFSRNYKIKYGGSWQYYYMYGLERYQTFRDKVENRQVAEPKWYNDGVDFLLAEQGGDGSWEPRGNHPGPSDTCFAIFFLTRSTQKTIGAILMNQGILKGGKGFQKGELRSQNGKIVSVPLSRSVGELLASLEEGDEDELAAMAASVAQLKFDGDPATRTKHQAMLRGLVSHSSYEARIVAVKTLAEQRDLDNVPALIFALSDPDWRVALEARDGLRFISRKITGFGLPKRPKKSEVAAATEKWKAWYLSVRPDGKLFN